MPQNNEYFSILTQAGLQKQANSIINNTPIRLTHIALGNADYTPTGYESVLKNEVYRTTLTRVALDATDAYKVVAEAIVNGSVGGFWIREVGILDADGDLFAIGRYPATYKPVIEEGAIKDLCIRMVLKFSNAKNVELVYNSGIGGAGNSVGNFLTFTDYGYIKENVPFSTEARPTFEYDFAVGDYSYDYGNLHD